MNMMLSLLWKYSGTDEWLSNLHALTEEEITKEASVLGGKKLDF